MRAPYPDHVLLPDGTLQRIHSDVRPGTLVRSDGVLYLASWECRDVQIGRKTHYARVLRPAHIVESGQVAMPL